MPLPCDSRLTAEVGALVLLLALSAPAWAADEDEREDEEQPLDSAGTFNLLLENDTLAGTDRNYTGGMQLSYLSAPRRSDSGFARAATWLPGIGDDGEIRFGVHVAQEVFTPEDTELTQAPPGQRPYAAWLYGGFSVVNSAPSHIDTWSLSVGTIGPDAKGKEVQANLHDWLDSDPVNGWDSQLNNKTGAQLIVERKWRALAQTDVWRLGVDFMPHAGLAIGNLESYANVGFSFRLGNDLDNDFGPPRIRPSLPATGYFVPHDNWAWYLFAGVEGRYVERSAFIEGTDKDPPTGVTREDWVGDAQAGLVLTRGSFRLSYTYVYQTEEFEQQPEPDRFASVALTWRI